MTTQKPRYEWKTPYNQKDQGKFYEVNLEPTETLPDQSMSVQEILRRYASGLPLGGGREPVYNEESESLMNYERLDKVGKIEVQRRYQERLKEIDEDLQLQEKTKREAERQNLINQEVEKKFKEKTISLKTPPEAGQTE